MLLVKFSQLFNFVCSYFLKVVKPPQESVKGSRRVSAQMFNGRLELLRRLIPLVEVAIIIKGTIIGIKVQRYVQAALGVIISPPNVPTMNILHHLRWLRLCARLLYCWFWMLAYFYRLYYQIIYCFHILITSFLLMEPVSPSLVVVPLWVFRSNMYLI